MIDSNQDRSESIKIEELKKYITTLQSDVTKLHIQLFKSEESVKKLQELNATYCKVFVL